MFNYHTHTHFCDGSSAPEAYVTEAIRLGFNTLGFSGHAPVPFENHYAIPAEKLADYCTEIRRLKSLYAGKIQLLLSLEIDCIPGSMPTHQHFTETCDLDYTIGSIHLVQHPVTGGLWFIDGHKQETWDNGLHEVMNDDIQMGVSLYYKQLQQMVVEDTPTIIGHLDKIKMHNRNRFFNEDEKWYDRLLTETLEIISQSNCIVEINTRGIYKIRSLDLIPSAKVVKKMKAMGIPVTISSDAHDPAELPLLFDETFRLIAETGYKPDEYMGLQIFR
jgi:histidinol-phosphatase (PHP family)